jgi:hypothetical protein
MEELTELLHGMEELTELLQGMEQVLQGSSNRGAEVDELQQMVLQRDLHDAPESGPP